MPRVLESGRIHGHEYVLMQYVNASMLNKAYSDEKMREMGIYEEMGRTLRIMHGPKAKGFGKFLDGKAEFEKFEDCIKDIKAFVDFAEKEGFSEIVLLGHSLGCSKVAYYYYKTHDKRIKKIIFASQADMVGFREQWDKDGKWIEWAKKKIQERKGIVKVLLWGEKLWARMF